MNKFWIGFSVAAVLGVVSAVRAVNAINKDTGRILKGKAQ